MKKKITTLIISFLLVFNTLSTSFANPLVAVPISISYNSLMALMGIGVAFGIALPKTDEEYWDYTRSLKNHLSLVDDDYIKNLDKIVTEWKSNNNNKPDNEKDPLKIPYIPGLSKLFEKVGEEVSQNNVILGGTVLDPLPLYDSSIHTNYENFINNHIDMYNLKEGDTLIHAFKIGEDIYRIVVDASIHSKYDYLLNINRYIYKNGEKLEFTTDLLAQINLTKEIVDFGIGFSKSYYSGGNPGLCQFIKTTNLSTGKISYTSNLLCSPSIYKPLDEFTVKPEIEYVPSSPSIDSNNEIDISYSDIEIPNIENLPNYQPELSPPFEVEPSPDPDPDPDPDPVPDPDPDPDPDNGVTLPSFPSFGDSLDFSPMYLTNVTEKFPFSLPWDIGRLIEKFDVEPIPPIFEVPILSETITLDLTEFSELASIVRFFVLIGFILSLIFVSTKLKG